MPDVSSDPPLLRFLNAYVRFPINQGSFVSMIGEFRSNRLIDPKAAEEFKDRGQRSLTFIKNNMELVSKYHDLLEELFNPESKQTERSQGAVSELQRLFLDAAVYGIPTLSPGPKLQWTFNMNSEWADGLGRYLLQWTFDFVSNPTLIGNIARCGSCGRFFIRPRNRKWCSVACGKRAKARKWYHKNRSK